MYHIIQSPKKRDPMSNTNVTLELLIKEQLDPLEHIDTLEIANAALV